MQSMFSVANQMLQNAPMDLLQRSEILFTQQDLVLSWKGIFSWKEDNERYGKGHLIYLPKDTANVIVQRTLDQQWRDVRRNMNVFHPIAPGVVNDVAEDEKYNSASPPKKRHASPTSPLDEDLSKRPRMNFPSKQVEESRRFTELLKSYYHGDSTVNLQIGDGANTNLASTLSSKVSDMEM